MIIYLDTSVLGRVYLGDQADGVELARVLHEGAHPVVTSELTDVEIASAFGRARRDGTIDAATADALLELYRTDTSDSGPLGLLALDIETLALAQSFVLRAPVRSLDAIHLAACARFSETTSDEVRLLSRDHRQNEAAHQLGIALADT